MRKRILFETERVKWAITTAWSSNSVVYRQLIWREELAAAGFLASFDTNEF